MWGSSIRDYLSVTQKESTLLPVTERCQWAVNREKETVGFSAHSCHSQDL